MELEFIDNNADISVETRRRIRSRASRGHRVGRTRPSRLRELQTPTKRVLFVNQPPLTLSGGEELAPESSVLTSEETQVLISPTELPIFMPLPAELSGRSGRFIREFIHQIPYSSTPKSLSSLINQQSKGSSYWIDSMFSNEAYFHCIVSLAIVALGETSIQLNPQDAMAVHFHMTRCLRLLSEKLSGAEALSDSTLAVVVALTQFDRVQGRYERGFVHFEGMYRLVELRGGAAAFRGNPAFFQKVARADLEFALYLGTATRFRAAEVISARTVAFFEELHSCNTAPVDPDGTLSEDLGLEFKDLFRDVVAFSNMFHRGGPMRRATMKELHNVVVDLAYCLVHAIETSKGDSGRLLECAVYHGLMAFVTTFLLRFIRKIPNLLGFNASYIAVAQAAAGLNAGRSCGETQLWILLLGGATLFAPNSVAWALPFVQQVSLRLDIHSWDEARKAVLRLPWLEDCHNYGAERIWKESRLSES